MLFRGVCICVCLAVVLAMAAAAAAVDPNKRDWASVYCNSTELDNVKNTANKTSKTEYERALKQWNNLDATLKDEINKMIEAKNIKTFNADKFAKIPMACLLRLPLNDAGQAITLEQTLAVAVLGNTKMVEDAVRALSAGDKTNLLTNVLDETKPSATKPYKDTLLDEIKRTIGKALLSDVVTKVANAECPYLAGAMENTGIDQAQFKTLSAKFVEKSCTLDMAGVERMATKILGLYPETDNKYKKIASTADDIITDLKPLIPNLSTAHCKMLFSDARMTVALSTIENIETLDLKHLDGIWKLDKCQGGMSSPCLMILKKHIETKATSSKVTEANWESLGAVASYLDTSFINAVLNGYRKDAAVKWCIKFKLYKLYEFRGKSLNTELQTLVSQCTKVEPMFAVGDDWSEETVDKAKKYEGFIPFLPLSKLDGAKGLPKAVLCNATVFALFNKVVQYGKSDTIKTICDKYFDTTKPVVPEQKSCPLATPPGEKPKGEMAHPGITTTTVKGVNGTKAEALITDINTKRTVESLLTADACTIVTKATIKNAEMFYEAIKSPSLAKCFSVETAATKDKTEKNPDKMAMANINKATQLGIFAALNITKNVDQWTDADIERNVRMVPMVITPEILNMMTAEAFVLAEKMSPVVGRITNKAIVAVLDRVTAFLAISNSADPLKSMTADQADELGPLITYFKEPDVKLKNASSDVKMKYCDRMSERMAVGGDPMCRLLPDLAKVYTFCKAVKVSLTDGKWTAANVASMGNFACHIPKADVEAMAETEFQTAIATFSACEFMAGPTKEAFIVMVKKAGVYGTDPANWTAEEVSNLGQSLKFLPTADLDKIDKAVYPKVDLVEESGDCIKAKYGQEEKGYKDLVTAMHKSLTTVTGTDTAYTLSYDDLNPRPNSYLTRLTVKQIEAIPGDDLKALYRRFAYIKEWSEEQKKQLLTQIKSEKVMNKTKLCDFTASELINTGYLVTMMTVEDMKCLNFKAASDIDKATPLSSLVDWTQDQFKELAARYKANTTLNVKAMDEHKIPYLGSFMCGLSDADVETVSAAALKKALSKVVDLYINCNRTKLAALLKVAQQHTNAYGPIAKWTSTMVAEVGVIIAGVNKTEIAALNTLIADVPVDILKKIDPETIKYMSDAAKNLLPDDIKKELNVDGDKKASAATPVLNGMLLLVTLLVTARLC